VSERLRRGAGGLEGGGVQGVRGQRPPARGHISGAGPRHISGDDIFPGPHDIRWFFRHMVFCRWFSISG
jgi:hypothetical protein